MENKEPKWNFANITLAMSDLSGKFKKQKNTGKHFIKRGEYFFS
jgi:hypothetical protein